MPHRAPNADFLDINPAVWGAMFEQAPTALLLVAASGHITAANRAFQKLFDISDDMVALQVKGYDLLADPAVAAMEMRNILAKSLKGTTHQDHIVRYDPAVHRRAGEIRHIHVYLTPLGQGGAYTQQVLVTLSDITARVEADAQRQAKQLQLRTVVDHAPALIFLKSRDHRFILANKALDRVFGMPVEGRFDHELFPADEVTKLHAWDRRIMNAGEPETFEETLENPTGPRHFLTVKFPLRDEARNIIGVGGISQDITDRVMAEQDNERLQVSERAAREADKVKSEFLATMSHEIRTPLAGIIGLGRIVMDATSDPDTRKHVKNLDAAAHMLLHILNDVLDLSKLEAKKLAFESRSFDLFSLVESTCQTLAAYASGKGLRLKWHVDEKLPRYIISDGGRIAQVLNNLVNNAIKFSDKGCVSVEIGAAGEVPERGEFRLQLRVTDQGIGISEQNLARLFTPFSQADGSISRRFGGTGLGLTICRAIVEGMGGQIDVTTALGSGSTFCFVVPVRMAECLAQQKDEGEAPSRSQLLGRILVVEDNPVNQTIVLHQLRKLGLEADLASDGAAAVDKVRNGYYNVVFMDCHMPKMDGFEATRVIRAMEQIDCSTVPIVALTANALSGERERCLAAGMTDYLSKPVNTHDLYTCLSRYLRA